MFDITPILLQASSVNATAVTRILNSTVSNPQNLASGLYIYIIETITVVLSLLMVIAVSLQVARGYFLRILRKFTLRLTADLWWLVFIILRDLMVLLTVLLGLVVFMPAIDMAYPVAVPFEPLGVVLYAFALVLILTKDTDENAKYDTMVTKLLGAGTGLYLIGVIAVTETPLSLAVAPSTVSSSNGNIWGFFYNTFSSLSNHALYMYSFYISFALLAIAGLLALKWSLGQKEGKPATVPKPVVNPAPAPAAASPALQPQPTKPTDVQSASAPKKI
ncbi:MAG: hypothetical protein M1611_00670 [Candidatus Marsarchaeota archaeon]|jgi:hypothetical protein|nr:hypothetical protein [Candidatus Marsarchaeota archaeon]